MAAKSKTLVLSTDIGADDIQTLISVRPVASGGQTWFISTTLQLDNGTTETASYMLSELVLGLPERTALKAAITAMRDAAVAKMGWL